MSGTTLTTTNPDGTRVVDTYADGLLVREDVLPTSGSTPTTWTSYVYDGLRRLITSTDFTGDTHYTYFSDGTQKTVQTPGHVAVSVTDIDKTNSAATSTTRSDNGNISTPQNNLGETSSVSGAGALPTTFGYDTGGTGQLTSLTTYQSNNLNGTGAVTSWHYDAATGLLDKKQYADGTIDTYKYNTKGQLSNITEPGITGSTFKYDDAGRLEKSTLTDSTTGTVSAGTQYDDMGRPIVGSGTDNGVNYINAVSYNAKGQLDHAWFDVADASLSYDYFDGSETGSSPQALKSISLQPADEQTAKTTGYTYESDAKRLKTITVNSVIFTFSYVTGSNRLGSISAQAAGVSNAVQTTYHYESSPAQSNPDPNRLTQVVVGSDLFVETINGAYNQQDQLLGQTITRKDADGNSHQHIYGYGYNAGNADALTSATDSVSGTTTTTNYAFDGVGNLTSTQQGSNTTSLGTPNSVNQFSTLTYNARGDVTDDVDYTYSYDANDRMISVTPHDASQKQLKFGYDSSGRRLWKDVYSHSTGSWVLASSRHYAWDGTNLVAEVDGDNALLTGYTWGPTGLLAVTDYTASGGPKTYVVVSDISGNVVELIDPVTQSVVADYHYDAYGNLPVTGGANGPAAAVGGFRGKGLFYDSETPSIGRALLRDTRSNVWLERDPVGESGGVNLHGLYGGDPINESDVNGTEIERSRDPLAEIPGRRTFDMVRNEAMVEVQAGYRIPPNIGLNTVIRAGWFRNYTYGDLVNSVYDSKLWWYGKSPIVVENNAAYAKDLAIHRKPDIMYADTRSDAQRASDREYQDLRERVERGEAPPNALVAADIVRNNSSAVGAFLDTVHIAGPDMFYAVGSLVAPSGPGFVELPETREMMRGAPTGPTTAEVDGNVPMESYRNLAKELRGTGLQAHHVSQNAVVKGIVPRSEGLAVGMSGNAFFDIGSPHYEVHADTEEFWRPYRTGGILEGQKPTIGQYVAAAEQASVRAGYSPAEAAYIARQQLAQLANYGLRADSLVPRVPGRINQSKR